MTGRPATAAGDRPCRHRRRLLQLAGLGLCSMLLPGCAERPPDQLLRVPPREEWMRLGPLRSVYTQVDSVRMHALISLADPQRPRRPIVLVHGSGLSGQYMIPTARELAQDFHVLVPDIPGYGDSGDPGKILSVPEMADWIVAWMQAIGLPRASFLGNSFGCQVIADLAARHPALVEAAVLQGPTTPPNERSAFWQFVRWRQNQPYNPDWLGDVTLIDYRKAGLLRLLRSFMHQISDRIEDKMPHIRAPVLIVRGAEDPIAHQAFCARLAQLAPHGALEVLPDVAHTLVFTSPQPLAEATRRFLAAHPPAA